MSSDTAGAGDAPLPGRYACLLCGVCIATSEFLLETKDEVAVFSKLHGTLASDKDVNKTVACPYCEQPVGSRGDSTCSLRRDRVLFRKEKLEILLCCLKSQEMQEVTPILSDVFPHSNINTKVLQKSELRGFQLNTIRPNPDFVVVLHKNEGRTLLTDRNGFYHDVLGSAWQLTRGNVLVVLTRTVTKAEADLFDESLMNNLSTQGDQPTIGAISAMGRVLTWDTSPSKSQLSQLRTLSSQAYFREAPGPGAMQGLPGAWTVKKISKENQTNWCMLL